MLIDLAREPQSKRYGHGLSWSPCTQFGWTWLTIIPAAMEAAMTSRVVSITPLLLCPPEQSSATRGHGEENRSAGRVYYNDKPSMAERHVAKGEGRSHEPAIDGFRAAAQA